MIRSIGALAACAGLFLQVASAAAAGPDPEVLPRVGKWEVSYDDDACQLDGQFGDASDPAYVRITRYNKGDGFDLALFGNRFKAEAPRAAVAIAFIGGGDVSRTAVAGTMGNLPILMVHGVRFDGWLGTSPVDKVPAISPDFEQGVSAARITIGDKRPILLQFGSMGAPMAALRTCFNNLMRDWGFDPAVQTRLSREARPAAARWFSPDDYPPEWQRSHPDSDVTVRIDVEADGSVSACHVMFQARPDAFSDVTCSVIRKHGKFEPAQDVAGKPVRSFVTFKTSWRAQ